MNREMKQILGRFLFSTVVICCIAVFAAGTVTVKQKGEYNMFYKQYPVFSMVKNDGALKMSVDEKSITFELSKLKIPERYYKYIYYTPLSVAAFFIESLCDVTKQEKG